MVGNKKTSSLMIRVTPVISEVNIASVGPQISLRNSHAEGNTGQPQEVPGIIEGPCLETVCIRNIDIEPRTPENEETSLTF